jgi:hypothetical protein
MSTGLIGARRPSSRSVPAYTSSAGAEAIKLSATAGLVLDGWQADFMTDALAEGPDGKWVCFEAGLVVSRQSGKGSLLEARVLAGMMLFGEKLILWSAHEVKTATESFLRCVSLFESDPELKKQIKHIHRANGNEGIELRNGSRLRFVARTRGSGRGFSADLIILDEAYALTAEQMAAMIPTLSSRPNPQIWYTSSPPLDGLTGEHLFLLRTRGLRGNDPDLCWYDYGLPGVSLDEVDELNLSDRSFWAQANPALGIRISEEFVAREQATLPPKDFARERLGIWPRQITAGAGVIDAKLWSALVSVDPTTGEVTRPEDVALAVDINPARTHAAIVAVGLRPSDDVRESYQVAVIDYRPGVDWVVPRLKQLKDAWNPVGVGLDVKGPGGSLLLDLGKAGINPPDDNDEPSRGDLAVPTAPQVAAGFGLFVDAVRQRLLWHSDDSVLNQALAGAVTRSLSGGSAWDRGKGGPDISPLVAATLAYWTFVSRKHLLVEKDYDLLASVF